MNVKAIHKYLLDKDLIPDKAPELISDTNNPVYAFSSQNEKFILKIVTDTSIDLTYLKLFTDTLKSAVPVQDIITIERDTEISGLSVVICKYISGTDVKELLETDNAPPKFDEILTDFLLKTSEGISNVSPLSSGFGLYKTNQQLYSDFSSAVDFFVEKYTRKFARLLPDNKDWQKVSSVMGKYKEDIIKPSCHDFCIVSLDMNLKNFIWTENNHLALINVPVTGYLDRCFGLGEAASQLDGAVHDLFMRKLDLKYGHKIDHLKEKIIFTETLGLFGTLSAAAGNDPNKVMTALNWGYRANISQKIFNNVGQMSDIIKCAE